VTSYEDRITSAQKRIDKGAENLRSSYEKLQSQLADLLSLQNLIGTIGSF
jgi:hypothetical protein